MLTMWISWKIQKAGYGSCDAVLRISAARRKNMNVKTEKDVSLNIPGTGRNNNSIREELEYLWDEKDTSGKSYEIYLGNISRSPIVRSKTSGKYFMLPWSRIISTAVKAGIDI